MWVVTEMEEVIAKRFTLETGKKVRRVNDTIYHKQYPFLACHIDRKVENEDTILQCKTASAYKDSEWRENEIPVEYIIQEYHELACTGYKKAIIACLIGNHRFVIKEILYDKKIIDDVVRKEIKFWEFVQKNQMPMQITSEDSSILYALFPRVAEESVIELGDDASKICESLDSMKADYKVLEKEIDQQENTLKAMLKTYETGVTAIYKITWKSQITKRIDTEKMRKEEPGIYERFLKETPTRILRLSVRK